ncbi:Hypothetical predicted protein [Mytilus galloprovincialis]|uniref:Uncharacterized protein n=1 Tax=Mytilus galloprovincialis TaxID=29158 RepID=A0A8B6HHT0_MYTGA|nr:Hypothetical predicted protein [Mytilus galloprovincialis]
MCKDTSKHCIFEQVCEIRVAQCLIPPCPDITYCASTWGSLSKGGACPAADDNSAGTVQCFGDFGCGLSNNDNLAVLFVIFAGLNCRYYGNYRNPEIQRLQQTMCKDRNCGFEQVCEIRVAQCLFPPCPEITYCASTWGSSSKGGDCPAADDNSAGTVQCFGDFGCGISNNDVCCHNRYTKTSYCHTPKQ